MDRALRALAAEAGIASDWIDAASRPQRVGAESLRGLLDALGYPCATKADIVDSRARLREPSTAPALVTATVGVSITLPAAASERVSAELTLEDGATVPITLDARDGILTTPPVTTAGYHCLRFKDREIAIAVAPARCLTFDDIAPGARMYGLAVQLYALRRKGDLGIGDAGALRDLVMVAAREGADALALSPAHSLFAADPSHFSPYSPSSRLFLNPLFADPAIVFGDVRVPAVANETSELIDWPNAARAKYAVLRQLFDDFIQDDQASSRHADFRTFVQQGGDRLREHALFEAAHHHWFTQPQPAWNWRDWPDDWRSADGKAVAECARRESRAVDFHLFLQWLAARSFEAAQAATRERGMRIGLIADVAIGMSPGGSHAWSRHRDLLLGLNIGAPPDLFNTRGQDWGLAAFSPRALVESGFEPFLATLRAGMRHAGGVRIDHVMGLARLWLVPNGAPATEGAYLSYPLEDMLRLLALESHRHRAVVIGEDLGTVEPELRMRLSEAGVAGMDVLWFQRDKEGAFLAPPEWRPDAVAMTTTHDLPTVAGWWTGSDIDTRAALDLVDDETAERQSRAADRVALWDTFRQAGAAPAAAPQSDAPAPAVDAAIAFTAQSPAALALIPIEDVLGLAEQPNVPGTIHEHPNWRRRLKAPAREMLDAPQAQRRLKLLRERAR